jgi:D-hydroxyproline dehydrogenase subunit gamma
VRVTDAERLVAFSVDGTTLRAPAGTSVAAALLNAGVWTFRRSVRGDARAPLCGMGVCHECRVEIDGVAHQRACLVLVAEGLAVRTSEPPAP